MKKFRNKLYIYPFLILMCGFLFFSNLSDINAVSDNSNTNSNTNNEEEIKNITEKIQELNEDIDDKQQSLEELDSKIKQYEENIKNKQNEELTLQSQIEIIEEDISKKEASIESSTYEIEIMNLEIEALELKLKEIEDQISNQKQDLNSYLKEIYIYSQKTYLEIAVNYSSFSEYYREVRYLQGMQTNITDVLKRISSLQETLDEKKVKVDENKEKAEKAKDEMELKIVSLESEKDYVNVTLEDIEQDETKFQALVNAVKREKQAADGAIVTLEKELRAKLKEKKEKERLNNKNKNTNIEEEEDLLVGPFSPSWPVSSRRITAYFHDPDYPFKRWFEHSGIDIGVGQGTPVKSAAPGYVAIAKNAGMGYSYIMIIHSDGFATVYGHMSSIHVKPEEYVARGEVIGNSGGMPGMPGSGSFSTGPHLHFEIRLNGIPVDALNYLP